MEINCMFYLMVHTTHGSLWSSFLSNSIERTRWKFICIVQKEIGVSWINQYGNGDSLETYIKYVGNQSMYLAMLKMGAIQHINLKYIKIKILINPEILIVQTPLILKRFFISLTCKKENLTQKRPPIHFSCFS
jgi:hypothetical protein